MSSHTRILRREYTGKLSLKTTDHCIKASLLAKCTPKTPEVVRQATRTLDTARDNGQFLLELSNVLSSNECTEVIESADKCIFQNVSDKYRFGKQRNSSRLLALDEALTENLWTSINNVLLKEMETQGIETRPLGFDVTRGVWELHGVNEAIRINKYSGDTNGYFGPHKDAQYCPNGDERSILTLLIYLNQDFKGGETCFYFPKNPTQSPKGMTIKEEIDLHGGLKKGFKQVKIVPKVGHAVLSSQNILHEALPVTEGTKYILKTDVVVKRHSKEFGFAIEEREKKDYLTCLNYFKEAQQKELEADFNIASDLYEKALSIRYCYPGCLGEPPVTVDTSGYKQFPAEVWLHIFIFLSGYDIQNLVYAYPELNQARATLEQRRRNTAPRLSNEKYLPRIRYQSGLVTCFEFPDAEFFRENATGCCRVAAMYSFFLLGQSPRDDVYTVRYNPDTQDVCVVALEMLLTDVFYSRRCYGSFYNVRQQDQETRDPKRDFEASVDRNHMLIKHGAEFTGMELPDSFYAKTKVEVTSDDVSSDGDDSGDSDGCGSDDDYKTARRSKGVFHDNTVPYFGEIDRNVPVSSLFRFLLLSEAQEIDDDMSDMYEELFSEKDFSTRYLKEIGEANSASATFVSKLNTPLSFQPGEACICFLGPGEETPNKIATNCSTECYNHLVFDFQKSQLKVEVPSKENALDFDSVIPGNNRADYTGELFEYEVSIESILSAGTSFNHASCQCVHPCFDVLEYYDLKHYPHLASVHVFAQESEDNGKMMAWIYYNGIVAL